MRACSLVLIRPAYFQGQGLKTCRPKAHLTHSNNSNSSSNSSNNKAHHRHQACPTELVAHRLTCVDQAPMEPPAGLRQACLLPHQASQVACRHHP